MIKDFQMIERGFGNGKVIFLFYKSFTKVLQTLWVLLTFQNQAQWNQWVAEIIDFLAYQYHQAVTPNVNRTWGICPEGVS